MEKQQMEQQRMEQQRNRSKLASYIMVFVLASRGKIES
jgi:predicted RNA methylase